MHIFHELRAPQRVACGERHYIFDPTWGGHTGFGLDRCSTGAIKAQRAVLDRSDRNAAGEYRFRLYEEMDRIHAATLLFRGFGLMERDKLDVRLNGVPIAPDAIGRTRRSDAPSNEWGPLGRPVRCLPEQGRVDFRADPGVLHAEGEGQARLGEGTSNSRSNVR